MSGDVGCEGSRRTGYEQESDRTEELSMRVGKIAGFELRIHWSTLVIFALLVWSLAAAQLPDEVPGSSEAAYVVAALIAGVAFYVALLAHEVSHALVARHEGIEVHRLTLWILGGIAELRGEPASAGADLRIAGVGPAVSLGLAGVFAVTAALVGLANGPDLAVATIGWLAGINFVIGLFNLIPAAPLDGGRILRAALWAWRGDRTWAAVSAARAGQVFGYLLIGFGLITFFRPGVGGLWFLVLGWFVLNAARAEQAQTVLRDTLGDRLVSSVMSVHPVTAPADATVGEVLHDYVLTTRHSAFPLQAADGRIVGLVTLNRLRSVPAERRDHTPVMDVACPIDEVVRARPDDRLVDLLARLGGCADGRALVFDDDRSEDGTEQLAGIVTPTDVTRQIELAGLAVRS
jgi:Zn-dependent protease/CBS domain-containing protein